MSDMQEYALSNLDTSEAILCPDALHPCVFDLNFLVINAINFGRESN